MGDQADERGPDSLPIDGGTDASIPARPARPTRDDTSPELTLLLNDDLDADERARRLLPMLYSQLRASARKAMSNERVDHTFDATALVHEAYLKLSGDRRIPWKNRAHFYAAAAEAMRRILIDHARSRARSESRRPLRLENMTGLADLAMSSADDITRFDDAYRKLQSISMEAAEILRMRLFAGLGVRQTAELLGVSPSTVDRRWAFVRAWIYKELRGSGSSSSSTDTESGAEAGPPDGAPDDAE